MTDNLKHAITSCDSNVENIEEIYEEALKLQNYISKLWGLDENSLQRIEKLQEQLIFRIDKLAPGRAADLRTMLHILNVNHHPCLIQVSNRTRALVFSEFLRRVTEFLEGYK